MWKVTSSTATRSPNDLRSPVHRAIDPFSSVVTSIVSPDTWRMCETLGVGSNPVQRRPRCRVPRLTRAEQQARTVELLLDAAEHAFRSLGYHPVTVEAVAERAGFTRGAVYGNFPNGK